MRLHEIENEVLGVLKAEQGKYLLAYQIFKRLEQTHPDVAARLLAAYPAEHGRPPMGQNAGIYYSVASFIAQALNSFLETHSNLHKAFLASQDIQNDDIVPSDPKGLSIWAWQE